MSPPFHCEVDVAGLQHVLAAVRGECFDMLFLPHQQIARSFYVRRIGAVHRMARVEQRDAHYDPRIGHQCNAPRICVAIEQGLPAAQILDSRRPVADADRAPEIRHVVLAAGIETRVAEVIVDLAPVGEPPLVDWQQHVGLDHRLDHVVARENDVIAGIARLELGKHVVEVGIEVILHLDAGLS